MNHKKKTESTFPPVIALVLDRKKIWAFDGIKSEGGSSVITTENAEIAGFGYDPILMPDTYIRQTFFEMGNDTKKPDQPSCESRHEVNIILSDYNC